MLPRQAEQPQVQSTCFQFPASWFVVTVLLVEALTRTEMLDRVGSGQFRKQLCAHECVTPRKASHALFAVCAVVPTLRIWEPARQLAQIDVTFGARPGDDIGVHTQNRN